MVWEIDKILFAVLGLNFVGLSIVLFIRKPAWALTILTIVGINVFGTLQYADLPSLSLGGLGALYAPDFLLLCYLGIMLLKSGWISTRYSISRPLMALLLLTVFEGVLSFVEGTNLNLVANGLRHTAYFLLYFLTISSIKTENEMIQLMKLMLIVGIITAGVTYYQATTGKLLRTEADLLYSPEFNLYQSINLGMVLMMCTFLGLLSLVIAKKIAAKYRLLINLILVWIGGAIFLILSRGIWISMLLAIGIILILNISRILISIVVLSLITVLFIVGFPVIERMSESSSLSYIVTHRFSQKLDSSYQERTDMMSRSLEHLIDNPSLFGYGFTRIFETKASFFDPTVVSYHNLLGDLAARYGFSGFIVFGWLFFAVFRQIISLLRNLPDSWQKALVLGLLAFNIQQIILSFSSNNFFTIWGIVIYAVSWAVPDLINRFHKKQQMKNVLEKVVS